MRKRSWYATARVLVATLSMLVLAFALAGCSSNGGATDAQPAPAEEATDDASQNEEREADAVSASEEEATEPESEPEPEPEPEPETKTVEAHLNEAISTEAYDLEFVDAHWDVADSEGKWLYYDSGSFKQSMILAPDAQVFVVRATITNKCATAIKPSFMCRGTAIVNSKYEYNVRALTESGTPDITPLETADVLIYVELPQAMKDQFEDISIKWGFVVDDTYPQSLDDLYEVYDLYLK